GLVVEQTASHVLLKCISRKPGAPTIVHREWLARAEVERVELLPTEDRDLLRRRLEALAKERELLAAQLKLLDPAVKGDLPPADALKLAEVEWELNPRNKALSYTGTHFRLTSTASRAVVQLAAIQLEQFYDAYARFLPPRVQKARPTAILLTPSPAEYRALVQD